MLDPGEDIEVLAIPVDEVFELLHTRRHHARTGVGGAARFDLHRRGLLRLSASTLPNAAKLGTNP